MIRRGKSQGWLKLDLPATRVWAEASGISFGKASPAVVAGRGTGLVADCDLATSIDQAVEILSISQDLVLSVETCVQHALFDHDYREMLESLEDFGRTPRGAILSFLLFQASVSCPDLGKSVGVHVAFTDYVKTLPLELLPTFWTEDERSFLQGTTLGPAVASKLASLQREYDLLTSRASKTRWYGLVEPYLDLEDWLHVDAMFRSRALDFYGSCMIPGMDMASHASGQATNAFYEKLDSTYVLYQIPSRTVKSGEEITITYGDEKGACEMVFSYGFLEEGMSSARALFLSLDAPPQSVMDIAKPKIAQCPCGFKIVERTSDVVSGTAIDSASMDAGASSGDIEWDGDYIWLLCMTEDDGFEVQLAQTVDNSEVLQATFRGEELRNGAADLHRILSTDKLWDVYQLRAVIILQQRVLDQMQALEESQEVFESCSLDDSSLVRPEVHAKIGELRRLEFDLLNSAYNTFELQKLRLASSQVVQDYLEAMNPVSDPADDFS